MKKLLKQIPSDNDDVLLIDAFDHTVGYVVGPYSDGTLSAYMNQADHPSASGWGLCVARDCDTFNKAYKAVQRQWLIDNGVLKSKTKGA